ncbi:MAG: glutamate 5-kinase [Opitutae bacterium]|nr:glutamate 5-kinase [Opitutae bacterium]
MSGEEPKRVVLKLGTGVISLDVGRLNEQRIDQLCHKVAKWKREGYEPLLVSSGAVGLGMGLLGFDQRPADMATLQACAAVGQSQLIEIWQRAFSQHGLKIAQVLLTREDLRSRERHLGVRATLDKLLSHGVVPIINENDTVSNEEIKFGDNDVLSALVASLVKAERLVILTTVVGLIDFEGSGNLVPVVENITPSIEAMAGGTRSVTAVGGMISKIEAAKVACHSGCGVFIIDGRNPENLDCLLAGQNPGTFFVPATDDLKSRKRWLAFFQKPQGMLIVDAGAREAVLSQGGSLLAKGIIDLQELFDRGAMVYISGPDGNAFARGICQFSSSEVRELMGMDNTIVQKKFPSVGKGEIVHRDSLVLLH